MCHCFIIPKWDQWRSEDVHPSDDLLRYLTGFTGSLGILIMTDQQKILFVDSRYTLQAQNECPGIDIRPYDEWQSFVRTYATSVTVDPWLFTEKELAGLPKVHFDCLIDHFWPTRPKRLSYPISPYTAYTDDHRVKVQQICQYLHNKKADGFVVTNNESWSWLMNIRSYDRQSTLSVEQRGIIYANGTCDILDITTINPQQTLLIDQNAPMAIREKLPRAVPDTDPIMLIKACKSPLEIQGFKYAHQQDAKAMKAFLTWLEETSQPLTEMDAEEKLLDFRQQQQDFIAPSFQTISACGPHGAIVHYRACPRTNRPLTPGDIYLLDSGGHYHGGTTDVTRTILYKGGNPPYEVKENFTLVLKGLIALSNAIFPKGTTGAHLDVLARQFLWKKQRNYGHGTGHGVGTCLSVHEGPQSISPKGTVTPLLPGMVVSIEPGFYKPNAYGIRLENLAYVKEIDDYWYLFETLTDVPIDTRLILVDLLSKEEKQWAGFCHMRY